jgi:hypothetical protein
MKYSDNFERDYNWYLKYHKLFNFSGTMEDLPTKKEMNKRTYVVVYRSAKKDNKWEPFQILSKAPIKSFPKELLIKSKGILYRYKTKIVSEKVAIPKDKLSAKECFYNIDTNGVLYNCKEPALLKKLFKCKGSINFNIKMWAEDRWKGWLGKNEFDEIANELELLDWMVDAVEQQKFHHMNIAV